MKTSARNQLSGKVTAIRAGVVNDEVEVRLDGGDLLTAVITHTSTGSLGLAEGSAVVALIKAPWIILATNLDGIRLSARNRLEGRVEALQRGAVNTEVRVALTGGASLAAVITNESADDLQLQPGGAVTAIIKASHVILGVRT